jgi:hypothetical protein
MPSAKIKKSMSLQLATVQYQSGRYHGNTTVNCDSGDSNSVVIQEAKLKLMRKHSDVFPAAFKHWEVIHRSDLYW